MRAYINYFLNDQFHQPAPAISFFVLNGHHVDLGKFGIFGIRSKQKAATDAEEVDISLVKHLTVGYKPSTEIKKGIAGIRIEVVV